MVSQYLLKCPVCQHPHPVSIRQAGESFVCSECQAKVAVPSMSGIRALPPVTESSSTSKTKREWSHRQGVLFTSGLLALIIFGAASGISFRQGLRLDVEVPEDQIKAEEARENVDTMGAAELWYIWANGYGTRSLGEWRESRLAGARRWKRNFLLFGAATGLLAAGGVGAMIYSLTSANGSRQRSPAGRSKSRVKK